MIAKLKRREIIQCYLCKVMLSDLTHGLEIKPKPHPSTWFCVFFCGEDHLMHTLTRWDLIARGVLPNSEVVGPHYPHNFLIEVKNGDLVPVQK